jgi:hypothetical protein
MLQKFCVSELYRIVPIHDLVLKTWPHKTPFFFFFFLLTRQFHFSLKNNFMYRIHDLMVKDVLIFYFFNKKKTKHLLPLNHEFFRLSF